MLRVEGGKESVEEMNDLLKDVETKNKALYNEKSSSTNSTSSKSPLSDPKSKHKATKEDSKDKKSSIWKWKPLKAFSLSRNRRFKCSFSVQVHLIEGLPLSFNDSSLCVHWKRKDTLLVTPPAKVIQGVAEFQEILTHTCSIYGSKSGPHKSAKYEATNFSLYASMLGSLKLDLGKHRMDLTKLLPLTLEELEEGKSSGKWTTSYRLSGTAKGAVMNVTFWYVIVGDSATRESNGTPNVLTSKENSMHLNMDSDIKPSAGSLPSSDGHYYSSENVDEVKDLHKVFRSSESAQASSVDILHKEFIEEKTYTPLHDKPELEVFKENIDPIKLTVCSSSDSEKGKPQEYPASEVKTCSLVHDKLEFDVLQENLETVKTNGYPLPDFGIGNSKECDNDEFSVIHGVEFPSNECVELEESITEAVVDVYTVGSAQNHDTAGIQVSFKDSAKQESMDELINSSRETAVLHDFSNKKDDFCTKELLLQELESALDRVLELERVAMESPKIMEAKSEYKLRNSHILDDVTNSVASEFLSMLSLNHSPMSLSFQSEPESPREPLLRQFEKEALSEGFSLFDFDRGNDNEADGDYDDSSGSEQRKFSTDSEPAASSFLDLQKEHLIESENVRIKKKVQMLVDLETEALMCEWGLDEKAFQHSPTKDYNGFGSPVYFLPEEPLPLPPLENGLGPFLQTKDGGFLRSMSPSLFRNSKIDGRLIMQVSNPVVMPAEMGSGIMEILQCLASVGMEKLVMQASKLFPLEDITGKTLQQISLEAEPVLEATHRKDHLQHDLKTGKDRTCMQSGMKGKLSGGQESDKFSNSVSNQRDSEFVSLKDLAPLAMDKIESLSLEGLRIQSGMSEDDAPSNIIAQSFGDISALRVKGGNSISGPLGLEGAAALQLLDTKDNSSDNGVEGIMGLTLTLDEWMRLDSGEIDDIDNISEHTSKFLAAYHANSFDLIFGNSKGENRQGKSPGKKCGLLGNNFTVALMVQLRDPQRNYEPVGTRMLALIQVERLFAPPKQNIYRLVPKVRNYNDESDEFDIVAKVEIEGNKEEKISEEVIPQFRIREVHVAGLKTEPHKKMVWRTSNGQQ